MNKDIFDNDIYAQVGERIRKERIKAKISQEYLAQALDLTRASIVNIEKGRQRAMLHTIIKISNILDISYLDLINNLNVKENLTNTSNFTSFKEIPKDAEDSLRNFVDFLNSKK